MREYPRVESAKHPRRRVVPLGERFVVNVISEMLGFIMAYMEIDFKIIITDGSYNIISS